MAKKPKEFRKRGKPSQRIKKITPHKMDKDILLPFTHYRALRTSHICGLTGRSLKSIDRRLRQLRDSRHLATINPKDEYGHKPNPEGIHALGDEGTKYVAKPGEHARTRQAERNTQLKQVAHTMLISDFMVAVELACRANDTVRFMPMDEILLRTSDEKQASKYPLHITAPIDYSGSPNTDTIVPDQLFGLEFSNKPKGRNHHYFFLEADRSTMVQERIPGMRSEDFRSIKRKMLVYYGWRRDRLNESEWDIENFRVLFLTSESTQRYHNMIATNETVPPHGGGWNQFLFAYKKDLFSHLPTFPSKAKAAEVQTWARGFTPILHAPWTDGEGTNVSFLPPSTKVRTSELLTPATTPD